MSTLITLVLVLLPLFAGFLLPPSKKLLILSETVIRYLVYVILFYIGVELSQVEGLFNELPEVFTQVIWLSFFTIGFGVVGLFLLDRFFSHKIKATSSQQKQKVSIVTSLLQISCVMAGFLAGYILIGNLITKTQLPPENTMTLLLMLLILCVGISLNCANIRLKQVLMNRYGVLISMVFCMSVWLGGVTFAVINPQVNLWQGLALSSGFGWYSLSGIIITESYGAVWGSVALFNDLIREFFALICIPLLMRISPASAIGSGGATSLDFTLPVIQQSGGLEIVPTAISFGFIINLVSPVAMIVFSNIG